MEPGPLIKELIDVFYSVKSYKLEQLKTPSGFEDMLIGGGYSIKTYRKQLEDPDEKQRILGFLTNVVDDFNWDYQKEIANAEAERMFEVSHQGNISQSLKDAHVCQLPLLSFRTTVTFQTDILDCQKYVLDQSGERYMSIRLPNLYFDGSVANHEAYLLHTCQQIILEKKKWDPVFNPSWRTEVTAKIIADAKYPNYNENESVEEIRAKNTAVVIEILKANGWIFNYNITRKNKHRDEIWKVFTNDLTHDNVFISVDLGEGEFEIQDRHGKWVNTTFFDGRKNANKNYQGKNTHDITIK